MKLRLAQFLVIALLPIVAGHNGDDDYFSFTVLVALYGFKEDAGVYSQIKFAGGKFWLSNDVDKQQANSD